MSLFGPSALGADRWGPLLDGARALGAGPLRAAFALRRTMSKLASILTGAILIVGLIGLAPGAAVARGQFSSGSHMGGSSHYGGTSFSSSGHFSGRRHFDSGHHFNSTRHFNAPHFSGQHFGRRGFITSPQMQRRSGTHHRRYRHRRQGYGHYYGGWWYALPWRLSEPNYEGYCEYWSDRCALQWGYRTREYYGCMRHQGCD